MLSAVTPPLGKMVYTTKEGDGDKSAVKVKGMENEPFNTEEGKENVFIIGPLRPPSALLFVLYNPKMSNQFLLLHCLPSPSIL